MMESSFAMLISLRDFFNQHIIFTLGILLFTGYFLGKISQKIKLPSITGYIIAGLLLSDSVTGIVRPEIGTSLTSITEIALGLIALTIGGEFTLNKIRRIGNQVVAITIFESVFAFIFITVGLTVAGINFKFALLLGSIGVATAPAATTIIVRELRARGKFIDYLYGVVALDDAVSVILFSIVFSFVSSSSAALGGGLAETGIWHNVTGIMVELTLSALLGFAAGYILHILTITKFIKSEILLISLAMVFIITSMAVVLHLSLIITNIVMGGVLINLSPRNRRIFTIMEPLTTPVFALFFIIAGTKLHISVFSQGIVMLWGAVYIISRFMGKASGVYIASVLTKAPDAVRKYLSFCLFPQAGVAIGLVLLVQGSAAIAESPVYINNIHILDVLVNIVLLNVLINELIGPAVTKYGIKHGADL
ncbi:cation:proton antiporter [Candidatus Latescibacterota bacterium]